MSTPKEIDTLKRKVYLAYHQDGILDLVAATVLLGFGAFMVTGSVIFLIVGALVAVQYFVMKQRLTIPRFGYVRFEPKEKTMLQGFVMLGLGVLALFLFFIVPFFLEDTSAFPDMQRYHMVPLSAMLFALPALMAALLLGLKRFYLYALLAVGLPALGAWLNIETFIPIMATGLVLLAVGSWLLANFLKQYPAIGKDGDHVNR